MNISAQSTGFGDILAYMAGRKVVRIHSKLLGTYKASVVEKTA